MTEPVYSEPSEQTFDFRKLLSRILKNWYWILASVIAGLAVATWINRYTAPMY